MFATKRAHTHTHTHTHAHTYTHTHKHTVYQPPQEKIQHSAARHSNLFKNNNNDIMFIIIVIINIFYLSLQLKLHLSTEMQNISSASLVLF